MQVVVLVACVGYLDEVFYDCGSLARSLALKDLRGNPTCHLEEEESKWLDCSLMSKALAYIISSTDQSAHIRSQLLFVRLLPVTIQQLPVEKKMAK